MRNDQGTIAIALLASILVVSCTQRDAPQTAASAVSEWKLAIEEIQGSVQDAWAQEFKKRVETRSAGEIRVTIYPYGSLGTSDQLTELVQNGAIQFAMASPGHLGKLIPETQVFLLHFVLPENPAAHRRVLGRGGSLQQSFTPLYREKGLQLLSFFPEGWQVWTTRKPIRSPADFAGVKMRVMTSPLLIEAYEAYGADPTPLPYAEVYSALQLGMIDGQVNPVFAIEEMSFYEVTEVLTFPRHSQFVTSVVAHAPFFEGLTEERRGMVTNVIAELEGYIFEVQQDFNARRLDQIREKKPGIQIVELDDEEREAFRAASLGVRESYADLTGDRGREILEMLLAADQSSTSG